MLVRSTFLGLKNFYDLAHQYDNLTSAIEIDCTDVMEDGDTAAVLIRGADGSSYPVLSTFEGGVLRYSFTSADLKYPGNIYVQAAIYGANGKIKHSKVIALHISKSIAGDEEPPEAFKAWLDEAVEVLEELKHSGGGGSVTSVNGQTGEVSLTAADVGALPDDTPIPQIPTWVGTEKPTYTASEIKNGDSNVGTEIAESAGQIEQNKTDISRLAESITETKADLSGLHTTVAGKADKSEIPSIPSVLPNPNALTFTGAVTGTYDGSSPLSIEIPQGGGGGTWEKITGITIQNDVTMRVIDDCSIYSEIYILLKKEYGLATSGKTVRFDVRYDHLNVTGVSVIPVGFDTIVHVVMLPDNGCIISGSNHNNASAAQILQTFRISATNVPRLEIVVQPDTFNADDIGKAIQIIVRR